MSYQSILVPVDGSALSLKAIDEAAKFATSMGSKITLVQVLELDPYLADDYLKSGHTNIFIERGLEYTQRTINEAKQRCIELGLDNVQTLTLEGTSISEKIIEAVNQVAADLIIISSHGRSGLSRLILGSQTQKILAQATVPVLVIR